MKERKSTKTAASSKAGGSETGSTQQEPYVTQEQLREVIERIMDHTADAVQFANQRMHEPTQPDQPNGCNTGSGIQSTVPQPESRAVTLARLIDENIDTIDMTKRSIHEYKQMLVELEKSLAAARLNHLQNQREFDSLTRERVQI